MATVERSLLQFLKARSISTKIHQKPSNGNNDINTLVQVMEIDTMGLSSTTTTYGIQKKLVHGTPPSLEQSDKSGKINTESLMFQ